MTFSFTREQRQLGFKSMGLFLKLKGSTCFLGETQVEIGRVILIISMSEMLDYNNYIVQCWMHTSCMCTWTQYLYTCRFL